MHLECCFWLKLYLMAPLFPHQDCVQLNQYKLQSEIGKVGLGAGQEQGELVLGVCGSSLSGSSTIPLLLRECEAEPRKSYPGCEGSFVLYRGWEIILDS